MGNTIRIRVMGAAALAVVVVLCCPAVPPAPGEARWFPRDSKPTCTLERIPGKPTELLFRFTLKNTSPRPISISGSYWPHDYVVLEARAPRGDVVEIWAFADLKSVVGKETEFVLSPGESYTASSNFAFWGGRNCKPGACYTAVVQFPHSRGVASSPVVHFRFPAQRET